MAVCKLLLVSGCEKDVPGSAGSRPLVPALFAYGMAWSSSERTGSQTVSKTPEQREQVRGTSGSFDERARSATAPAVRLAVRLGVATGLVVQGQQEEGTRGALAAASCARVSVTQVATCFRPRDLCGSGEGHVITSTWLREGCAQQPARDASALCCFRREHGSLRASSRLGLCEKRAGSAGSQPLVPALSPVGWRGTSEA